MGASEDLSTCGGKVSNLMCAHCFETPSDCSFPPDVKSRRRLGNQQPHYSM